MTIDNNPFVLGRPRKNRINHAGEKLRMAFLLLNKTWGSNLGVPNHIFNMKRWDDCGLPKSIKTVKEDIRTGIPYDRISNYASILNIPPNYLADMSINHTSPEFISAVVRGKSDTVPPSIMMQNVFGESVNDKFIDYNRPEYINELFSMIKGFYVMYMIKIPFGIGINKLVYAIHDADAYYLHAKSYFYLETDLNIMVGELHRWGTFLYSNYYLSNMQSFGVSMMPEPLRSPVIARRKPFYMTGKYLFGSEAFGRDPVFAVFHLERREELPQTDWEDKFESFCHENISYQFLFAGDQEYDYAMARLHRASGGNWTDSDSAPQPS